MNHQAVVSNTSTLALAIITLLTGACDVEEVSDESDFDSELSVELELDSATESEPEVSTFVESQVGFDDVAIVDGGRDVSITNEEFDMVAKQFGLELTDEHAVLDLNAPSSGLSSWCSMPSSYTSAAAELAWIMWNGKSPSCYGYKKFSGDNESDCYIKFSNYQKKSEYDFIDTNACAAAATAWYSGDLAAYYDSSANVYLRMDRLWCEKSNCEDGFKIK